MCYATYNIKLLRTLQIAVNEYIKYLINSLRTLHYRWRKSI